MSWKNTLEIYKSTSTLKALVRQDVLEELVDKFYIKTEFDTSGIITDFIFSGNKLHVTIFCRNYDGVYHEKMVSYSSINELLIHILDNWNPKEIKKPEEKNKLAIWDGSNENHKPLCNWCRWRSGDYECKNPENLTGVSKSVSTLSVNGNGQCKVFEPSLYTKTLRLMKLGRKPVKK